VLTHGSVIGTANATQEWPVASGCGAVHVDELPCGFANDLHEPRRGYRFIAGVRNTRVSPGLSIAVLPFVNLGSEKENEYFGDGLAEEVINELTKIPGLKVIARTSAFAFKGQNRDIRSIAEALGVANVLEGSVRNGGNRIRVTAQLIAASDGSHLWSGRYDLDLSDVLSIQDEIAQAMPRL
jgi:TolB-like protein